MKRLLKVLAWMLAGLIVLLILAIVGLRLFFPMEKVRQMAVEESSKTLNREIEIKSLDLSFWGGLGVQLQGVTIGNPEGFEGPPVLSAEYVDLKMKLLPLLTGDFEINRLIIEKPTISLVKRFDGQTNYIFEISDSADLPPEAEQIPPESRPAAAAVSFDEFEIRHGSFAYLDELTGDSLTIFNLALSTSLVNARPGVYNSRGSLSLDSVLTAGGPPLNLDGLGLDYNLAYDQNDNSLDLERLTVSLNGVKARGSGSIRQLTNQVRGKGNFSIESVELADFISLLTDSQKQALKDFTVDGQLTLDVDVEYFSGVANDSLNYVGTATLDQVSLARSDIKGELKVKKCLVDFKPDNVRLTIEEGSFADQPFKTHLLIENFESPRVEGEIDGQFDLGLILPLVATDFDFTVGGMTKTNLKLSGPIEQPDSLSFSGHLQITDGFARSELLPEPLDQIEVDAYFDNRVARISSLSGKFPSGRIGFSGRVTDLAPYLMADDAKRGAIRPEVEGNLTLDADLALAKQYLPKKGDPNLAGELKLNLTVQGILSDFSTMRPRGTLTVVNATYTDSLLPEPVEKLDVSLVVEPDTITVKSLKVKFTSSDVALTGRMIRPFPYLIPFGDKDRSKMEKPYFLFELASGRFDTDKMFPEAVPGASLDTTVSAIPDSVSMFILPDIDGRGTMKADTVIYSQVELTNVDGKIRISGRKIEIYEANASVYSGSVTGKTTIDLNDFERPIYTGEFEGVNIEANDFLTRFTPFSDHLYGKANMTGDYNAVGWDPDAFLNSLNLNARMDTREAKLVTSGALYKALSEIASRFGEKFDKEQSLKGFGTNVKVKDGKVMADKLSTTLGRIGIVDLDGFYAFSGGLNYDLGLELNQQLTEKSGIIGDLLGKNGRLRIPFKFGGTIDQPTYTIDWSALTKPGVENLKGKAIDELKDKAGGLLDKLKKKK